MPLAYNTIQSYVCIYWHLRGTQMGQHRPGGYTRSSPIAQVKKGQSTICSKLMEKGRYPFAQIHTWELNMYHSTPAHATCTYSIYSNVNNVQYMYI